MKSEQLRRQARLLLLEADEIDRRLAEQRAINPKDCPHCNESGHFGVDAIIYHENGHAWPGFAGEPY